MIFGNGTGAPLISKAMDSAAAKGPAAVNDLLRVARENGLDYVHVKPEFPPDFDFKTLAAAGELKQAVEKDPANPAILAWSRQDRDAAFQWTLQNVGAKETFDQLLPRTGGTLTWSAARYEAMDEGQRGELRAGFLGPRLLEVPNFSSAIQDPVLRDEVLMQGVQGIFVSDRGGAMSTAEAMLELLGTPERRLEILENLERAPWPASAGRQTPVDEARLRELMGGWTTDQTRIDTIIDRLKKP